MRNVTRWYTFALLAAICVLEIEDRRRTCAFAGGSQTGPRYPPVVSLLHPDRPPPRPPAVQVPRPPLGAAGAHRPLGGHGGRWRDRDAAALGLRRPDMRRARLRSGSVTQVPVAPPRRQHPPPNNQRRQAPLQEVQNQRNYAGYVTTRRPGP
uniref:Uncharacterized protein n=1 Tax=Rhipicephalus appendiculatus TaxID=34631 RepID=A0A131YD78_RHIAP